MVGPLYHYPPVSWLAAPVSETVGNIAVGLPEQQHTVLREKGEEGVLPAPTPCPCSVLAYSLFLSPPWVSIGAGLPGQTQAKPGKQGFGQPVQQPPFFCATQLLS